MNLDIDWATAWRAALGALPVIVTLAGLARGPGAVRSRLKHDVELLEKLPEGTAARESYEKYLETQVNRLAKLETESSRDLQGLVISVVLVVAIGGFGLWLMTLDHWVGWVIGVAAIVFAAAGLGSVFDDAQKVPRDEKGKRI
jgi:hypothetical protein